MIVIGVDPSIQSTGIYINKPCDVKDQYHLICSKPTKKLLACPLVTCHKYDYLPPDGDFMEKERRKTWNVCQIISIYKEILIDVMPDYCVIEAIAMSAAGRIDALAMLNGGMRYVNHTMGIPIYAVPPTSNKLQFTGNGQAPKEVMVESWKRMDPRMMQVSGKVDDLADAYALANFPV